ncbi:hypothetical protein ACFX13_026996 [Malus domestica]
MINREFIRSLSFEQLYRVWMNNQSTGRNQRPAKGLKVKQAIQIALILAVCFWLLYEMKQSHDKDHSESSKDKASEERGSDILGPKGSAGWSKGGAVSASEDPKHVGEVSVLMHKTGGLGAT